MDPFSIWKDDYRREVEEVLAERQHAREKSDASEAPPPQRMGRFSDLVIPPTGLQAEVYALKNRLATLESEAADLRRRTEKSEAEAAQERDRREKIKDAAAKMALDARGLQADLDVTRGELRLAEERRAIENARAQEAVMDAQKASSIADEVRRASLARMQALKEAQARAEALQIDVDARADELRLTQSRLVAAQRRNEEYTAETERRVQDMMRAANAARDEIARLKDFAALEEGTQARLTTALKQAESYRVDLEEKTMRVKALEESLRSESVRAATAEHLAAQAESERALAVQAGGPSSEIERLTNVEAGSLAEQRMRAETAEKELARARHSEAEAQARIRTLVASVAEYRNRMKSLTESLSSALKRNEGSLQSPDLQGRLGAALQELDLTRHQLLEQSTRVQKLEASALNQSQPSVDFERVVNEAKLVKSEMQARLNEALGKLEETERKLISSAAAVNTERGRAEKLAGEIAEARNSAAGAIERLSRKDAALAVYRRQIKALGVRFAVLLKEKTAVADAHVRLQRIAPLEESLKIEKLRALEAERVRAQAENRAEELQARLEDIQGRLDAEKATLYSEKSRVQALDAELKRLKSAESEANNKAQELEAALTKYRGHVKNLTGRLAKALKLDISGLEIGQRAEGFAQQGQLADLPTSTEAEQRAQEAQQHLAEIEQILAQERADLAGERERVRAAETELALARRAEAEANEKALHLDEALTKYRAHVKNLASRLTVALDATAAAVGKKVDAGDEALEGFYKARVSEAERSVADAEGARAEAEMRARAAEAELEFERQRAHEELQRGIATVGEGSAAERVQAMERVVKEARNAEAESREKVSQMNASLSEYRSQVKYLAGRLSEALRLDHNADGKDTEAAHAALQQLATLAESLKLEEERAAEAGRARIEAELVAHEAQKRLKEAEDKLAVDAANLEAERARGRTLEKELLEVRRSESEASDKVRSLVCSLSDYREQMKKIARRMGARVSAARSRADAAIADAQQREAEAALRLESESSRMSAMIEEKSAEVRAEFENKQADLETKLDAERATVQERLREQADLLEKLRQARARKTDT